MVYYRLKSCDKCQGDLVSEEDEWKCLQCGRCFYPSLPNTYQEEYKINSPSIEEDDELFIQNNKQILKLLNNGLTPKKIERKLNKDIKLIFKKIGYFP